MASLVMEEDVRGQVGSEKQGEGVHQEFNFDFAEFEIYLDIQVEIPVSNLVNKSQMLGRVLGWRFKIDGI